MKKIIPILLIMLVLAGCKVKEYTPEIPSTFTQRAVVSSGDFSFDCEICKNINDVTVTVLNTNANGMTMKYDGKNVVFNYEGYSHTVSPSGVENTNTAIVIYEVFDCLLNNTQTGALKIDGGYEYKGKVSAGDFILIQNDDNSINKISVPASDFQIEFAI